MFSILSLIIFIFCGYILLHCFPVPFLPCKPSHLPLHVLFQIHGPFFHFCCIQTYIPEYMKTTWSVCIILLVWICFQILLFAIGHSSLGEDHLSLSRHSLVTWSPLCGIEASSSVSACLLICSFLSSCLASPLIKETSHCSKRRPLYKTKSDQNDSPTIQLLHPRSMIPLPMDHCVRRGRKGLRAWRTGSFLWDYVLSPRNFLKNCTENVDLNKSSKEVIKNYRFLNGWISTPIIRDNYVSFNS